MVHAQTGVEGKNDLNTALQIKLDEWHKAGSFPGATLGVVLANGESFGLAVGFSDRESRTPMKPTDRMLAGSVGKTFAAATALQLIKEGKIGLDDKIEKYLGREPWFSVTDVMYFPEQKVAVAVQVNTSVGRNLGKPPGRVLVEMMEAIAATQR